MYSFIPRKFQLCSIFLENELKCNAHSIIHFLLKYNLMFTT